MLDRATPSESAPIREAAAPLKPSASVLNTPRSLRHEYTTYVEQEIEEYKESVPRGVLLGIGDEAVASLARQPQLALTELLLCEEVDRIIFRRLGLPSYQTWRRRRMKLLDELRRPEHWGLSPDDVLVRNLRSEGGGRVLLAGDGGREAPALYLAANGCEVTALSSEVEAVERVLHAAVEAGLAARVHGCVADLASWRPEGELTAVIVTPAALAGLTPAQRARVIGVLQSATADGGVHLLRTIAGGKDQEHSKAMTLAELRTRYRGWAVTIEHDAGPGAVNTFLARKQAS